VLRRRAKKLELIDDFFLAAAAITPSFVGLPITEFLLGAVSDVDATTGAYYIWAGHCWREAETASKVVSLREWSAETDPLDREACRAWSRHIDAIPGTDEWVELVAECTIAFACLGSGSDEPQWLSSYAAEGFGHVTAHAQRGLAPLSPSAAAPTKFDPLAVYPTRARAIAFTLGMAHADVRVLAENLIGAWRANRYTPELLARVNGWWRPGER